MTHKLWQKIGDVCYIDTMSIKKIQDWTYKFITLSQLQLLFFEAKKYFQRIDFFYYSSSSLANIYKFAFTVHV